MVEVVVSTVTVRPKHCKCAELIMRREDEREMVSQTEGESNPGDEESGRERSACPANSMRVMSATCTICRAELHTFGLGPRVSWIFPLRECRKLSGQWGECLLFSGVQVLGGVVVG